MITVTEKAQAHLKNVSDSNNGDIVFLGVDGGGCAGFSYKWAMKTKEELDKTTDTVVQLDNGAAIAIDGTSLMYLLGSIIDLKADIFGTVLEIKTPAASTACGCGESINFDMDLVDANMKQFYQAK